MTIALLCGTLGLVVAMRPSIWLGLFSNDAEVARLGAMYLRIVGPVYVCFGLGPGCSSFAKDRNRPDQGRGQNP